MDARETLQQWFTDTQIKTYFGARSPAELDEIANRMQAMSSDARRKFKKQLSVVAWKQAIARQQVRRGHSVMGRMLVSAAKELKR